MMLRSFLDIPTRIVRSFAAKLVVLLIIFLLLPVILYSQFRSAYEDRTALLLRMVQEEGQLITQALLPLLESFQGNSAQDLVEAMNRVGAGRTRIKLLFRPRVARTPDSFFYVASVPSVNADYLNREKVELLERGILGKLPETCEGGRPLAQRYVNPQGEEEILTSITPVAAQAGCWVLITSRAPDNLLASSFGQPYWKTPEVQIAGAIYLIMAVVVLSLFLGVWRSIRGFAEHARDLRLGRPDEQSFSSLNQIPELSGAAEEFDNLVDALNRSADRLRQAAEENAHAFKAPLAVISQSIEPLKSGKSLNETRRIRSVDLIERSVAKLDALISAARRMDEMSASLINLERQPVKLSSLVETMLQAYVEPSADSAPRVRVSIAPDLRVIANEEMLETVIENLLDNAVSFTPPGGGIEIELAQSGSHAVLTVADEGPGVPDGLEEKIFERYFSHRPAGKDGAPPVNGSSSHFGIGLWVVRRNVEALGGRIDAENREGSGLRVTVRIPLMA